MKNNKLIVTIVIVIIIIVSIISVIIIVFPDYFNLNHSGNRVEKKVFYNLTYDNYTDSYNLMIGPFIDEFDKFIDHARITINIGENEYDDRTNVVGMTEFDIYNEDLDDIIDKEISGKFRKDDYYDADFEFTISKLNERGDFEILIGRRVS
jgi:hypothetical protein